MARKYQFRILGQPGHTYLVSIDDEGSIQNEDLGELDQETKDIIKGRVQSKSALRSTTIK